MKKHSRALIVTAFALTATASQAATFNIQVVFGGGLTLSQQSIFSQAETFWESVIIGYKPNVTLTGIVINAAGSVIDGAFGILGSAGPDTIVKTRGTWYATEGSMNFDTADMAWMEGNGSLLSVIMHEMAHVIGFGTLWTENSVYVNNSGQFTGSNALAAYRSEFNSPSATFVQVETDFGPGTANGHWDENWAGGTQELMTGFLDTPAFVSNTTVRSFADIGYTTANLPAVAPVPLPAGAVLLLGALGVLGAVGARRRQTA